MKRKLFVATFLAIFMLVVLSACASNSANDGLFGAPAPMAAPMPTSDSLFHIEPESAEWAFSAGGAQRQNMAFYDDFFMSEEEFDASERRISTTAFINMETDDLEPTIAEIRDLVWVSGGFIEQANFSAHDGHRRSSYNATLRVPGENYDSFLDSLREIGEITLLTESTQDHTAVYFDASIRLETRQIEEERIIELIERARYSGEISDLLELESLLRNVRLEIEGLTRQIDHIDRLVAFHTIHLTLLEVEEHGIIAATTLIDRTGAAFTQSLDDIVSLSQNMTIFIASIIAPAALIAAIIIIIRTTRRKLKKS